MWKGKNDRKKSLNIESKAQGYVDSSGVRTVESKKILHYIVVTLEHGIWYAHVSNFKLVGYTDSDWGGSVDGRKAH